MQADNNMSQIEQNAFPSAEEFEISAFVDETEVVPHAQKKREQKEWTKKRTALEMEMLDAEGEYSVYSSSNESKYLKRQKTDKQFEDDLRPYGTHLQQQTDH